MYNTRKEANANANGNAVIQVYGGYKIVGWDEYYRMIREEAASLHRGCWRHEDKEQLQEQYGFDDEHVEAICDALKEMEETMMKYKIEYLDKDGIRKEQVFESISEDCDLGNLICQWIDEEYDVDSYTDGKFVWYVEDGEQIPVIMISSVETV